MTPAPISVERLREIVAFLLGEGELDGHSFGDGFAPLVAGKYPAVYWWRTQLREQAEALPALLHQLAETERLEANARKDCEDWYRRYEYQREKLDAAERAREEATEDAATERALQRAAEKLPDGWEISVVVENGAGWVTLHDPEGELVEFEDSDRTIAQQVTEATDTAIAANGGV